MAKIGLIKGFVQGCVWSGSGSERIFLPFQDTVMEATFSYTGELVESMTFSDQGVMGASQACLQSEACGFNMVTEDISWSFLQASTLSTAETRTKPVLVTETFTASDVTADPFTELTLSNTPVTTSADLAESGLPTVGVSVAGIDGNQLAATVSGSTVTLDQDVTGQRITVQYLRAALSTEEVIYLGQGQRREQVGVYGKFFGCPGTLLIVAPKCAVTPSLEFGVSSGSVAQAGLNLQALRQNGYFAEITRLDCENC